MAYSTDLKLKADAQRSKVIDPNFICITHLHFSRIYLHRMRDGRHIVAAYCTHDSDKVKGHCTKVADPNFVCAAHLHQCYSWAKYGMDHFPFITNKLEISMGHPL